MSQQANEKGVLSRVLTTVTNKVAVNRRAATAVAAVAGVVGVLTAYKYRHEITSWSYGQAKRVGQWWR